MLKQKKIFNKLIDGGCDKILKSGRKTNYDDWTYPSKIKSIGKKSFNNFDYAFSFWKKIRYGIITLKNPKKFKYE